jgi:hypothetical protein
MLVRVLRDLVELRANALRLFGIDMVVSHPSGQSKAQSTRPEHQIGTSNAAPPRDIAIVSMSTPEIKAYADSAHANHLVYARQHNYSAFVYKSVEALKDSIQQGGEELRPFVDQMLHHRHPIWWKILVVLRHLRQHKYVVWVDADAIFTSMSATVEEFIAEGA